MYSEEDIMAYLRGDLADNELLAFEEALKTDTNLATSLAFMSDIELAEDVWGETGVMQSLEEVWQEIYAQEENSESNWDNGGNTSVQTIQKLPKKYIVLIGSTGLVIIATILYLIFGNTATPKEANTILENTEITAQQNQSNFSETKEDNKVDDLEEIKKRIEEINQKEEAIEKIKQKIGKPKNEQEVRYLKQLKQQQELYQQQKIAIYDEMIASVKSEVILPKVDTLVDDDVVFSWDKKYQNQDLELEVFTKETQVQPQKIEIRAGKVTHKQKLSSDFYYWRLKVKHGKTIGLGRFMFI